MHDACCAIQKRQPVNLMLLVYTTHDQINTCLAYAASVKGVAALFPAVASCRSSLFCVLSSLGWPVNLRANL